MLKVVDSGSEGSPTYYLLNFRPPPKSTTNITLKLMNKVAEFPLDGQ